jgi:hypothetical protein
VVLVVLDVIVDAGDDDADVEAVLGGAGLPVGAPAAQGCR